MEIVETELSCRLGHHPEQQGPRSQPSGTGCEKSTTTICANCGKVYQRKIPFNKHVILCRANSASTRNSTDNSNSARNTSHCAKSVIPSQNTKCKICGKEYKYLASLKKHEEACSQNIVVPTVLNTLMPSKLTQHVKHFKSNKLSHPERLKIIIWKACKNNKPKKNIICEIRSTLKIDSNIPLFVRGKRQSKRVEMWCKDRSVTMESYFRIKGLCKTKSCPYFCTLGKEYSKRKLSKNMSMTMPGIDTSFSDDQPRDNATTTSTINILQWNAQSINNKVDELRLLLKEENIDIACICETRIKDSNLWTHRFKGYTTLNSARQNKEGGGTCIILRENFGMSNVKKVYTENLEYIQLEATINKNFHLVVTSLYARDGSKNITPTLDKIPEKRHSFIAGDFNAKHALWGSTKSNPSGNALSDWINDQDLIILNSKDHTYQSHSSGQTDSMDISISSPDIADRVVNWKVLDDSLGSDHFPIITTLETPGSKQPSINAPKWNIKKADRTLFKSLVNTSANEVIAGVKDPDKSIEEKVDAITSCIIKAAEGSYTTTKTPKKLPAPWWNKDIKHARKVKRKARRKWKHSRSMKDMIVYKKNQASVKKMIKEAQRSSWRQFISSINRTTPSSIIWKKIKAINGVSRTSQTAIDHDGQLVTDLEEQANLFGEHYSEKCSLENPEYVPEVYTSLENTIQKSIDMLCETEDPCDTPFTMNELRMALEELKTSATGEDLIHNQMLKDLPENGKRMLLEVFNEIWESGQYPNSWKVSKIIPLLKPNKDKQKIKSYRPVALTSCLGKLLERIINRRLSWRIEKNNIFHSTQCGFRPKAGTLDALLKITEQCQQGIHEKKYTVIVFLDLEGAFDKVWWEGLLIKAAQIGISGKMLKSLKSFLSERNIKVQVGTETSQNFQISAGTPQGAVLSPTIFNIMMYDLPLAVKKPCEQVTYADDGTLMITHNNLSYIKKTLNRCLQEINKWAGKWKLKVSKEKTEYTVITRKKTHELPIDDLGLSIESENIRYNKNPKILGLILDPVLSWKNHIDNLVISCTSRINLMKTIASNHWGADLTSLRSFYLAFIRSKISYAMEIWSSCSKTQLAKLCKIQNIALRLMTGALRTSPIAALEIEGDIPPLDLFTESVILKKRIKQHFMPHDSPGYLKKSSAPGSFYQRSSGILSKRNITLPERSDGRFTSTSIISSTAPWLWTPPSIRDSLPGNVTKSDLPAKLQQLSLELIHENYKDHSKIYTDGSLDASNGLAGAGVYFQETEQNILIPLPPCSILKAELIALERALEEIRSQERPSDSEYVILTDSKSSLQSLKSYTPTEYYQHCKAITDLLSEIPSQVMLQWIPSHIGILGNEKADHLAKSASVSGPVNDQFESQSSLNCTVASTTKNIWADRWKSEKTGRSYFDLQKNPNTIRYANIRRQDQVMLTRIKLNHFPCQSYLHRFKLSDSPLCQLCELEEETIKHIIYECSELTELRKLDTTKTLEELLENRNNEWEIIFNMIRERRKRMHARVQPYQRHDPTQ